MKSDPRVVIRRLLCGLSITSDEAKELKGYLEKEKKKNDSFLVVMTMIFVLLFLLSIILFGQSL